MNKNVISTRHEILNKLIFFTDYGVSSIIYSSSILSLIVNHKAVDKFHYDSDLFINQIKIITNYNLKEDEYIMDEFNDIVRIEIITSSNSYKYNIPWFSDSSVGVNYLQRYYYDGKNGIFEYDNTTLSKEVFYNANFEMFIKAKLNLPLEHKLTINDCNKLKELICVFDEKSIIYTWIQLCKNLKFLSSIEKLTLYYASGENIKIDIKYLIDTLPKLKRIAFTDDGFKLIENSDKFIVHRESKNNIIICDL